jgi:selT/selW/selH-like putative selenoprotein
LAAAIQSELGIDAKLVEGAGGVFDVVRDDELIFSKQRAGRFPEPAEVLAKLR